MKIDLDFKQYFDARVFFYLHAEYRSAEDIQNISGSWSSSPRGRQWQKQGTIKLHTSLSSLICDKQTDGQTVTFVAIGGIAYNNGA